MFVCPVGLHAGPPDLTAAGVISTINHTVTYNLGPTGLRGWIYITGGGVGADGLMTDESRQILVTVVSPPGNTVLAVDDVILGAMGGSSGTVPPFTSDCRKAFGTAIGDAEKTGVGSLRVKRWRAGTIADVNIPMAIMGNYTASAPYNCPKSALILANARAQLVGQLLADKAILSKSYAGPIHGLALLAGMVPTDPDYAAVQTRLQTFARERAATGPKRENFEIWDWSYTALFLAEYYLSTGDSSVISGVNRYAVALAQAQSMYGTFGHHPAVVRADGTGRRSVFGYGPVNSAGIPANIAIVMCKKALVAASQPVAPEIDTAIMRGSNFFAWYVNKGQIPYGEHSPGPGGHSSNGKDSSAAVLFGLQAGRTKEAEFFTRMTIAGFTGREYGHTGQGLSYLWGAMGANMGGPLATAEYLKKIRWHLDLERRTDGSFVYDGQEQYGAGTTADGTYLGASSNNSYDQLIPTASYILTYALPLKRLYITGKNATPANTLDATKVANAIAAATFNFDCVHLTTTQLIASLSEYDPSVRHHSAIELAKRTLTEGETSTLLAMFTGADSSARAGACQTFGILKNVAALPLIVERLSDPDVWVRAQAAMALRNYPPTMTSGQLTQILAAFAANATDPNVIKWSDPLQISNNYLSLVLFGNGVNDGRVGNDVAESSINASKSQLYPALKAALKHPDSYPRTGASAFAFNRLSLVDVQALIPNLFDLIKYECEADRMWSASPRAAGIRILAKYKIKEGIPLALAMMNVPESFEMGSEEYLPAALKALAAYGDAARWTLPKLKKCLVTWNPSSGQYAVLVNTIASIEGAITAPTLIPGLAEANSQVVSTTGAKAITLTGKSPRTSVTFTKVTAPAHGTLTGTAPNLTYTPTAGYTGIDSFTFRTADDLTTSDPGTVSIIVGAEGNGLRGEYYDNADFTNLKLTRTDAQVDFDWDTKSPDASIGADSFSVHWSGLLRVPETATYQFSALNSGGARLYVNGVLIIDDSSDHATHWKDSHSMPLKAGQVVEVDLYYYKNAGPAVAKLKWTGPSFAGANGSLIAKEWLYEGTGYKYAVPYAHAQSMTAVANSAQAITLSGSRGTLKYAMTQPAHGVLKGTAPNLTYHPNPNFTGADSFTFAVANAASRSTPATVTINVWRGPLVSYTWLNAASGNWSAAGNWTAGAPAATGQVNYSLNFAQPGTYTVTQDLNNGFLLNQVNVDGAVSIVGTNRLDFAANGTALPQFNQNSSSAVTVANPISFNDMTTIGGTGGGRVTLAGLLSGTGGLTKNNSGGLQITYGANTYSGGTVINAGIVGLAQGDSSIVHFLGSGPVTLNSHGTLSVDRNALDNSFVLNGGTVTGENGFGTILSGPVTLSNQTTFDFGTTGGFGISGNISGTGGFKTVGTTNWRLSGTNTYTGPTMVQSGGLVYDQAVAVGPGALILSAGAKVTLNYSGTRPIASLTLGGAIQPTGTYGSTTSEAKNKNDTYFSGTGTVNVLPATPSR